MNSGQSTCCVCIWAVRYPEVEGAKEVGPRLGCEALGDQRDGAQPMPGWGMIYAARSASIGEGDTKFGRVVSPTFAVGTGFRDRGHRDGEDLGAQLEGEVKEGEHIDYHGKLTATLRFGSSRARGRKEDMRGHMYSAAVQSKIYSASIGWLPESISLGSSADSLANNVGSIIITFSCGVASHCEHQ